MRLRNDATYRVYLSDGSSFNVTVLSHEGGEWYRVRTAVGEFFLNLGQAVRVQEI